jgi:hypothetical protein
VNHGSRVIRATFPRLANLASNAVSNRVSRVAMNADSSPAPINRIKSALHALTLKRNPPDSSAG